MSKNDITFQYRIAPITRTPNGDGHVDPSKEGFERDKGSLVDLERPLPPVLLAVVAEYGDDVQFRLTLEIDEMRYVVWR